MNYQILDNPEKQSFEIIVVDDGSTDNTKEVVESFESVKYIYQENKKQGAARNMGVKESSGDVLAFLGSDTLVQENWIKEVFNFHKEYPDEKAIGVGHITWTPELAKNRFQQWLELSGLMCNFKGLKNYNQTDFWHFYTGNISMKTSFFKQFYFHEDFQAYGWEDVLLGYEMTQKSAKIYYLEYAVAWHDHKLREEDYFPKRMQEIGKSAVLFQEKHPELSVIPHGVKKLIFQILSLNFIIAILKNIKQEWYWYALSKKYFLEGVENSQ